jgi:hypothetical protein
VKKYGEKIELEPEDINYYMAFLVGNIWVSYARIYRSRGTWFYMLNRFLTN